ncbi:MAG TPA: methyltransferase [Thermodesulfobacteriota bacterium]|nr:methyltransferase [Thermodesulfobacteriota bacterium]
MKSIGQAEILSLARNFMECRILLSGAELDLFTLLAQQPLSGQEIANRIHADLRGITILLDALSAMGLLTKGVETYQCPPAISALLSSGAPDTLLPWVLHMASVWKRWSSLTGIVQGSQQADHPVAPPQTPSDLRAFIGAMHVLAFPLAPRIVAAVDPYSSRALLDVGGAMGTYTVAFLQAVPEMKATLFDRPEVIEIARQFLSKVGLLHRVALVQGDFYQDEFPDGHDLAFVSAIIHQNSPEQNFDLYCKVFQSLDSAGRVIIRDHVMDSDRTQPKDGAIFAVNMLVSTPGGNTYTFDEIKTGLTRAGFINVRLLQPGEHMDALIEAVKP